MLTTLSFGAEASYCLDFPPTRQELTAHAPLWAVGTDDWGNIITYDSCDTREEADAFIREELAGRGIIMTDNELATALDMGEEAYA